MSFYDEIAATVNDALTEFGAPVTLTRNASAKYDPATGTTSSAKPTVYQGIGLRDSYSLRDMQGSLIQQGDERVYLATNGMVQPQPGDALTLGADVFQVILSRPIQPALTPVLFDVQVRRNA